MTVTKKQLKNLKPMKKGEKGRSNGRPKGSVSITKQMKEVLREVILMRDKKGKELKMTQAQMLAKSIARRAINGNDNMSKLIWNYMDGMPKQELGIDADVNINPYTNEQLADIAKRIIGNGGKSVKKKSSKLSDSDKR